MPFREPSEDDLSVGVSLYLMLIYCKTEDLKLLIFYQSLVEMDMRTIVQASKNNMELNSMKEESNIRNNKLIYEHIADILDLELGKVLQAMSTPTEIKALNQSMPYFSKTKMASNLGMLV